jgi:hypothetical protein
MADLLLHVRFTDSPDGWVTAQVVEVPGAISQGRTREGATHSVFSRDPLTATVPRHRAIATFTAHAIGDQLGIARPAGR